LKGGDVERIRRVQDDLARAARALTEAASRPATPDGGPSPSGGPQAGDVVDAEFREADDPKR